MTTKAPNPEFNLGELFSFFNEIGIINQLSSNLFQKRLPDGVTIAQFSVLNHLTLGRDGQTPLNMASAFQVPKTTMTHSLAGLENRGFIEMQPNADDGRSKCVWLTDAGRKFRDQAIAELAQDMTRISPKLNLDEVVKVIPVLARVRSVLDEDRD